MNEYKEEEFILLSGIQHFSFCRRQWALIHLEQQWKENVKTVEGNILHERCHDELFEEKRKDLIVTRGMRVFSSTLGVVGQCDVVEFLQAEKGAALAKRGGLWRPCPIEYKHGHAKSIDADRLQLCCQAMCLEEMLLCSVDIGYLYYAETHRREEVAFSTEIRTKVNDMLQEMHKYFKLGYTPNCKPKPCCRACSLQTICLPEMFKKKSVKKYYEYFLCEAGNETSS